MPGSSLPRRDGQVGVGVVRLGWVWSGWGGCGQVGVGVVRLGWVWSGWGGCGHVGVGGCIVQGSKVNLNYSRDHTVDESLE